MIYTIENILAKLYFKIHETGNIRLLVEGEEEISQEKLLEKWEQLVEQDKKNTGDKKPNEYLNISKKIERLVSKHNTLSKALTYLLYVRDAELEAIVKRYNYKLSEDNFKQDVEKAIKSIDAINNRIKKHQEELDALNKTSEKKETFEDTLMAHFVLIGLSVKDANTITLLEYRGVEKQVKAKIKTLEKQVSNGRKQN